MPKPKAFNAETAAVRVNPRAPLKIAAKSSRVIVCPLPGTGCLTGRLPAIGSTADAAETAGTEAGTGGAAAGAEIFPAEKGGMQPFPAELSGMGDGLRPGVAGAVSGFFSASLEKSAFNASTAKPMNTNGAIGGMFGLPFIIQLENPPLFCNCKQNHPLNGNARDAARRA